MSCNAFETDRGSGFVCNVEPVLMVPDANQTKDEAIFESCRAKLKKAVSALEFLAATVCAHNFHEPCSPGCTRFIAERALKSIREGE